MRIKKCKVQIRPLREVLYEAAEFMEKIQRGEKPESSYGLSFGTLRDFQKFFTQRRLELLKVIRHKRPGSVYELAKLVKRDTKSVANDVKILEEYNIIETRKIHKDKGYKVKPIFDADKLQIDVAI